MLCLSGFELCHSRWVPLKENSLQTTRSLLRVKQICVQTSNGYRQKEYELLKNCYANNLISIQKTINYYMIRLHFALMFWAVIFMFLSIWRQSRLISLREHPVFSAQVPSFTRRERRKGSDDRKYVCCSQATTDWILIKFGRISWHSFTMKHGETPQLLRQSSFQKPIA